MKRPRILVVDDEPDLAEILRHHLERERYEVATALDGPSALAQAQKRIPDLVVLDWMLPGMDGLEVCRKLKSDPKTSSVPILMLTAKAEEIDAVIGLAQGADDYVRKPFGVKELLARIAARLRPGRDIPSDSDRQVVRYGDLVVDDFKHEATLKNRPLVLTASEFRLLRHLVRHPGRAFERSELLDTVVGTDAVVVERNIDVHVASLRKSLGTFSRNLQTIRGVGYRLRERAE